MGSSMGLGSLSTQTSVLETTTERLLQGVQSTKSAVDSGKIDKGAREFETVLVGSWLQQAEQSFGSVPGGDDSQDVGRDSMMSFGVQTLATSMSNTGGIGIGKMIAKAMHAAADKANGQAPGPTAGISETTTTGPSATLVRPKRIEEKR
jgi:Rod binding domain-containing protein